LSRDQPACRSPTLLAEALELAPFGKFLYSPDAFGLPEPGTWGRAVPAALSGGLSEDPYSERTVARLTRMICADDATRAYRPGGQMSQAGPPASPRMG
jgi:hypothetical protein